MQSAIFLFALFGVTRAQWSGWANRETPLVTEYAWTYFDYEWKSPEQEQNYTKNGLYDPHAIVSIDVDRSPVDGRTFLTATRSTGVPASLHTISRKKGKSGPLLAPYPNWSWYENPEACTGITSVYRVTIDTCNRLWVLDTGRINFKRTCPAQLLAFDLLTDRLLVKIQIPDRLAQADFGKIKFGLLVTPVVEVGSSCSNVTVYIADAGGRALLVWDGPQIKRMESEIFMPDQKDFNFTIAGDNFAIMDGIFGMALSPQTDLSKSRYLFFKSLASRSISAVRTSNLRAGHEDGTLKAIEGTDYLPSQATVMAFSPQGVLFYALTREISIGCWNIRKQFVPQNFKTILTDKERLQFVSGIKVISDQSSYLGEYLLLTSNRFQKSLVGKRNFTEINFRVMRVAVQELIQNTACDNYT